MPTDIITLKEQKPVAYSPLILAEFTFADGSTRFISSAPLNVAEGGYQYNSSDYFARLADLQLDSIQARDPNGISRIPRATLTIHDSDSLLWTNDEFNGPGYAGANLVLRFLFWQADTATFSSNSWTPFVGICDGPQRRRRGRAAMIVITANASRNGARFFLPEMHFQALCSNTFPASAAQRLAAGGDPSSPWYGCGYCPDQTVTDPEFGGSAQRGNLNSGVPFTTCNLTKQDCVLRGMYTQDASNRQTGSFTGVQWYPLNRMVMSESYISGKWVPVLNSRNDAIFNQRVPKVYGTQWVTPGIANMIGDANAPRNEVVVCLGYIGSDGIIQVVVNGFIIPYVGSSPDPKVFRWSWVNQGSRRGAPCLDAGYAGQGDPYGSQAAIEIVYYSQISSGNSLPNVQVLTRGPKIPKYVPIDHISGSTITFQAGFPNRDLGAGFFQIVGNSDPAANGGWTVTSATYGPPGTVVASGLSSTGTGGYVRYLVGDTGGGILGSGNSNPVWVLLDNLISIGWSYSNFDLATFCAEAEWCDAQVSYTDLTGSSNSHARYRCKFALSQQRAGSEVIAAILRSFNAQVNLDPQTGLYALLIRKTLTDQHPALPAGSNYSGGGVSSTHFDGSAGVGFPAYNINESVVGRDGADEIPYIDWWYEPLAQTPNQEIITFQDEDNTYGEDSIKISDTGAIARAGGYQSAQEIPEQLTALGFCNFDQAFRVGQCLLAERLRGNKNFDDRGTMYFRLPMNFRLAHLKAGWICLFSWADLAISNILVRVVEIQPSMNFERSTITVAWHRDEPYLDAYGQQSQDLYTSPYSAQPNRLPYAWQPFGAQPIASDSLWGTLPSGYIAQSRWFFGILQQYGTAEDGSPIAQVLIFGCPPVNQLSSAGAGTRPPLMGVSGSSVAGGSIPTSTTIYIAIAAKDSSGSYTPLCHPTAVTTPSSGGPFTITTPNIFWQGGTTGWIVYAGTDTNNLSEQGTDATANGLGSNVTTSGGTTANPTTISISSLNLETYGPPDSLANSISIRAKVAYHAGDWGDACTAVSSNGDGTGFLTFNVPTPASFPTGFTTNQFAGYDIMLVARAKGDASKIPVATFRVQATGSTGTTLHVSPDPTGTVNPGDVFIMLFKPSIAGNVVTDANLVNPYGPNGLTASDSKGHLLRFYAGTGGNQQVVTVLDNTSTSWTVTPFYTTPDSTSRFIDEDPHWEDNIDSELVSASTPAPSPAPQVGALNIQNYSGRTLLVQANVANADGQLSLEAFAPFKLVFIWGAQGTRTVLSGDPDAMLITDKVLRFDTSSVAQPSPTTLSAAITTTNATSISVTSGANVVNGAAIQIDSEQMYVVSGAGTTTLTVQRGWNGTTAATHLNGATVTLPGARTWTLLSFSSLPNQDFVFEKISTDINYVKIMPQGTDQLPDGEAYHILPDYSSAYGTYGLKVPGA